MGKSENDEDYERGVRDGQRGNLPDDLIQAQFGDSYTPYGKGYNYGVEHRYGSKGQCYHSWDGSGVNDPKKSEESGKTYEEEPTKFSDYSGSSGGGGGGGGGGGSGLGCLIALGILLSIPIGIGEMIKEYKNEKQKKLMQENHRIEKYEPEKPDKEFQQILEGISEISFQETPRLHFGSPLGLEQKLEKNLDYSLSPDKSVVVYSKNVKYSRGHPLSPYKIICDRDADFSQRDSFFDHKCRRIFSRDLKTGLEGIIGIKDYDLSFQSEENDLTKELSLKDLVGPIVSPDGKKIVFASTREHDGSALCLMNDDGTNIQKLSAGASTAYGWIDDNILFFWKNSYSGNNLLDYEDFRRGKMSLINTSIDEKVELNELPKIDFLLKYVCYGKVKEYCVEDGVEGNQISFESGRRLWEKLWSRVQYNESLMDEKTLINTRLEKWIDKNTEIGKFNLIDYETIGDNTWVAIQRRYIHPHSQSYVLCSRDDKKTWEFKWDAGSLSRSPFNIEFLNEDEGYIVTGDSLFYTSDKGCNWETLLNKGYWWGEPEIVDFKIDNKNLIIKLRKGQIYASSDKGKTWEVR